MNTDRCVFTQKSWEDAWRQPAWKDQRQKGGIMRMSLGLPDGQSEGICQATQDSHKTQVPSPLPGIPETQHDSQGPKASLPDSALV